MSNTNISTNAMQAMQYCHFALTSTSFVLCTLTLMSRNTEITLVLIYSPKNSKVKYCKYCENIKKIFFGHWLQFSKT